MIKPLTYGEMLARMDLSEMMYPEKWFIVEVRYAGGGDITITEARSERGVVPTERDDARGFTEVFRDYETALRRCKNIAKELDIKAGF